MNCQLDGLMTAREVGQRLRSARLARKLDLEQAAALWGVSEATMRNWEWGYQSLPADLFIRLMESYGCRVVVRTAARRFAAAGRRSGLCNLVHGR